MSGPFSTRAGPRHRCKISWSAARSAESPSRHDRLAASLAEFGHLPGPSTAPTHGSNDHAADVLDRQPDAEFLLRLSAQKLFAEGRVKPTSYSCVTWLGTWRTDDRVNWRTADDAWLAQLDRRRPAYASEMFDHRRLPQQPDQDIQHLV